MCGQALVPLARPGLRDGFHEVSLQLADTGMVPEQFLLRLFKLLHEGKVTVWWWKAMKKAEGDRKCEWRKPWEVK